MNDKLFVYNDNSYPVYLKQGPASRFIKEFALEYCTGHGLNIGFGKKEWQFLEDAICLDIVHGNDCSHIDMKDKSLDYIFSSHTLEHIGNWKQTIANWISKIRTGGCMFLYLPRYTMEYWRPENCHKHKEIIYPEDIKNYLESLDPEYVLVTGPDLYFSFCVVCII